MEQSLNDLGFQPMINKIKNKMKLSEAPEQTQFLLKVSIYITIVLIVFIILFIILLGIGALWLLQDLKNLGLI